jgi:hypothetical protein
MSAFDSKGKPIGGILLCTFLALLAVIVLNTYRVIRTERVSTRLSAQLRDGQHEFVASLPSGHFQIQFTAKPNVGAGIIVPPKPVLPARISTRLLRQDGSVIVQPTEMEYVTFKVAAADAYRPLRLLVDVTRTNECTVYMNMACGF